MRSSISIAKNGALTTCVNIFKAAVGLGLITNPIFFAQTGWLLSLFLIIVVISLICYCIRLLLHVVEDIEKRRPKTEITDMEQCIEFVFHSKKWKAFFYTCSRFIFSFFGVD